MGLIYLIAFASLWAQVMGLIGKDGILPAAEFLAAVRERFGAERYWFLPTLCWISASDAFLHFLCAGGVAVSLALMVGIAPRPALILLWAIYLSLCTVSRDFLSFQWDILLLETGFLAALFASSPKIFLWLLRWLLFRLMFESGCVKLLSGDPTWWNLTALNYHYETQCLPTWIGWFAHQLPAWLQKLSVVLMFAIELPAPFLVWCGRKPRMIAFAAFASLQVLIALTGNYGFFNLLTLALSLALLDDEATAEARPSRAHKALAVLIFYVSAIQMISIFAGRRQIPALLLKPWEWVAPLRSVNSYGLFAVMTTSRPEIVVEGSDNGRDWKEYEFKWKAGDVMRRPGFVAPHQPRLDWQMWFAALGDVRENPWFVAFLGRLLQGSPEALSLLRTNPFPGAPPRFVRALLYDYHFTTWAERREGKGWWKRELKGLYCPPLTRQSQNP